VLTFRRQNRSRVAGEAWMSVSSAQPPRLQFAAALGATLEATRTSSANSQARDSLAWSARIVARLGGWSGYQRYGAPDPKTMAAGRERFNMMRRGWALWRHV
jgi:hypothetical protein